MEEEEDHTNGSIKQENYSNSNIYSHENAEFQQAKPNWSQMIIPVSSPTSCVTTLSNSSTTSNMLDFSSNNSDMMHHHHHHHPQQPDHHHHRSSEVRDTLARFSN